MNTPTIKGPSTPFSAYSRGVQLAGRGNFDFGLLLDSGGRQLVDISGAIVNFVLAQGWYSVINLVITIAANSFYTYLGFAAVAAELDFTVISFVVLLPLVLSVFHALQRRNSALNDLSLGKTGVFLTFPTLALDSAVMPYMRACLETAQDRPFSPAPDLQMLSACSEDPHHTLVPSA